MQLRLRAEVPGVGEIRDLYIHRTSVHIVYLLSLFCIPNISDATTVITGSSLGHCSYYHSANSDFSSPIYMRTYTGRTSSVYYIVDVYTINYYAGAWSFVCSEEVDYQLVNRPERPPEGATKSQILDLIRNRIRNSSRNSDQNRQYERQNDRWHRKYIPYAYGVRGSLGFSLFEHSPDWVTVQTEAFDPLLDSLFVPFEVDNAGDGDALTIGVNGVDFWSQPLSLFEPGVLYFAEVPLSLLNTDRDNVWTYFLESAGDANASVYIATELTAAPVPAGAWLFGSGLIGLLGMAMQKSRK